MGKTFQEHLDNLTQVLTTLREARLRLKPEKCHLVKREVCYLGYVVSVEGVSVDPIKVEAVRNFVIPADLKSEQKTVFSCESTSISTKGKVKGSEISSLS